MADAFTQADSAQHMYNARASNYDDSFHPAFAKHIIEYLDLQPGERLLDLACGTGLVTLAAAKAVGPTGFVFGVDITTGMLDELYKKRDGDIDSYKNIEIYNHDITKLDEVPEIHEGFFDAISLTSALPLLREPGIALDSWRKYLKPGGRIITDVTDLSNMPQSIAMERVYNRLGIEYSSNRLWTRDGISLRQILQQAGYVVEKVWQRDMTDQETTYHDVDEWETRFDEMVQKPPCKALVDRGLVEEAKKLFEGEWAKLVGENGKIKETFFVWVALARKPKDVGPVTARGSCACGKISWSTTAPRSGSSSNYHCITCRKLSGAPYITFVDVPLSTLRFSPPFGHPHLKRHEASSHAERTFCGECGSTLTMWYRAEPDGGSVAAGTIDEDKTIEGWYEGPQSSIYAKDVPSWYRVPDDGTRRNETMLEVERLLGGTTIS